MTTGQNMAHGDFVGNHAWQAMHAPSTSHQSNSYFGKPQTGVVSGNNDVAGQGHFKTTAQGIAVHRRDDRLPTGGTVRNATKATLRRAHHSPAVLSRIFQVIASRKRLVTSSGQDANPDLGVTFKIVPDLVQFKVRRWVQGVHALWTVQRHDGNAALFFIRGEFIDHSSSVPLL